jgi:predicted NBD/HSP70 family sugar kinase
VGIGIAVPSPVDPRQPDRLSEVVLPAWKGRSVTAGLREKFGLPVLVDNDANLGALAEQWWGAGRGVSESVYIKVATGVGSGHIIGGRIYRGASGTAGEIGHMAIDPHGRVCACGLRGCLVTFVGTEALVERAKDLLLHEADSLLSGKAPTGHALEEAALAGDPVAREVFSEAADYLGIAVASMLNLMNPSVVTIGGSVARLGDLLIEPLRTSVRSRTLVSSVAAARIVASELGKHDVAVGAATLVLDAALNDLSYFPAVSGSR